ncbi:MAG: hypothetical protein L0H64_23695, partial [Pseudonocardia sp.]|nr:hypothetical protein [Pseudonocardia sp.]
DPSRPVAPTVREIAALTARLRDISARGRAVDPAEREQFIADKDALIARITDTTRADSGPAAAREPVMPESMREQARATEAAIAAGTLPDVYPDDTAALAARITELRAEQAARSSASARVPEPEQNRREQLARWHAEDQADTHGDGHDDALTRFTCGGYGDEEGGTP